MQTSKALEEERLTFLPTSSLELTRSSISALSILLVLSSSSLASRASSRARARDKALVSFSLASASALSLSSAYLDEMFFSSANNCNTTEDPKVTSRYARGSAPFHHKAPCPAALVQVQASQNQWESFIGSLLSDSQVLQDQHLLNLSLKTKNAAHVG